MGSVGRSKSLQRDQQQQQQQQLNNRKSKGLYPQNVQQVCQDASVLAKRYHDEIERLFDAYSVKEFDESLNADQISDALRNIGLHCNIDELEPSDVIDLIKRDYLDCGLKVPYKMVSDFLDFFLKFKILIRGINQKLVNVIVNGLLKYCQSFAVYCNSDIDFVNGYEKIIIANQPGIIREILDIKTEMKIFENVSNSTRNVLYHAVSVIESIRKVRASINKLYYLIMEWTDEEKTYKTNIDDNIRECKNTLEDIYERMAKSDDAIRIKKTKMISLEKQLIILQKSKIVIKRKLKRIRFSQNQIKTRLKDLETLSTNRNKEITSTKKRLKHLEFVNRKTQRRTIVPLYKVSMEIRLTTEEQRELEAKKFRIDDSKLAIYRHQNRLSKIEQQLSDQLDELEKQINANRNSYVRTKAAYDDEVESNDADMKTRKETHTKLKDLNFLKAKKYSPDTFRQLKNYGKLAKEAKETNATEKMCELVSKKIGESWKELYLKLPMFPERDSIQRQRDIETIELLSSRNDTNIESQCRASLDKWRLFYHKATTDHLVEGLQKSRHFDIAKDVQSSITNLNNRFEDNDSIQNDSAQNDSVQKDSLQYDSKSNNDTSNE